MFASTNGLPKLTLTMLSAAVLLALSGEWAAAQNPIPRTPQVKPGQVAVMTAPAFTVVSTVHYQAHVGLNCSHGNYCDASLPSPGPRRRLNLTRITCFFYGPSGTAFRSGYAALMHPEKGLQLYQILPVDYSSASGTYHLINRAVDVEVIGGQYIYISLSAESGTATQSICSATGTLDILQ
jgi:hypothetical protein